MVGIAIGKLPMLKTTDSLIGSLYFYYILHCNIGKRGVFVMGRELIETILKAYKSPFLLLKIGFMRILGQAL